MSKNQLDATSVAGGQAANERLDTDSRHRSTPPAEFPLYVAGTQVGNRYSGDSETPVIYPHGTRCGCGRDISRVKGHSHNVESGECTCAFFSCQGRVVFHDLCEEESYLPLQETNMDEEAFR